MKQISKTLYEKFLYNNETYTRLYFYETNTFVWWNKLGFEVLEYLKLEVEYQKLKNLIKVGDKIIDIIKSGCNINSEKLDNIVICKAILDDNDLVWESLDGKSSACDLINNFIKV